MADQDVEMQAAEADEPRPAGPPEAVSTEQPPAYSSVFGRVRAARQQSTRKSRFITSLNGLIIGSGSSIAVGCIVCLGLMLALPISMLVMGSVYLDDCPVQRFIPIYLIVGGAVAICVNLMGLVESIFRQRNQDREERSSLSKLSNICEGIFCCFMIAWFIAGNVWIYSTLNKFTTTPGEDTYCNPTLYWYAFWITTAGYILLGVVIILGACYIIYFFLCCKFA